MAEVRELLVLIELFAGMAGMQVLEWAEFDSQIKTAGLKNVKEKCFLSHMFCLAHHRPK